MAALPEQSTGSVTWVTSTEDDPQVVAEQLKEDYTNHIVPPTARLARGKVLGSFWSIASAMAFLYYGALSASLVGTEQAIIGLVVVVAAYSVLAGLAANVAIRWGMNSTLVSREMFGVRGAALTPLLLGLGGLYYAVFESSVLAAALQAYFKVFDIRVWYVIVIAGMLPLVLGGIQTWMDKINIGLLPVYALGVLGAVVAAGVRFGWSGNWFTTHAPAGQATTAIPGWLTVFVLYMGIWVMIPDTIEFARFGRQADRRFHRNITFGWAFYTVSYLFNGIAGILIVAFAAPHLSIAESAVTSGIVASLGLAGLLVIAVSQVRVNTANFYVASISFARFVSYFSRRNLPRAGWVALVALVTFLLMFTNVFSYITTALAWQAALMVAWVGIFVTHRVLARTAPEFRPRRLPPVGAGFAVWVISAGVAIVLTEVPAWSPTLSALAPVVSLVLSVALYAPTVLLRRRASDRPAAGPDPRERFDDAWSVRVRCGSCGLAYTAFEIDEAAGAQNQPLCLECQVKPRSHSGDVVAAANASDV